MTEQMFLNELGENIENLLIRRGMSQRELAKRCNIHPSNLNRYIRAKSMPPLKDVVNISIALECNLVFLIPNYEKIF